MANSIDPDQTPHSAASDLGLYCLLRPFCSNRVTGSIQTPSEILNPLLNNPGSGPDKGTFSLDEAHMRLPKGIFGH